MEYKILRCKSFGSLEEEVNVALNNGWRLAGGVSVAISRFRITNGGDDLIKEYLVSQAITRSKASRVKE